MGRENLVTKVTGSAKRHPRGTLPLRFAKYVASAIRAQQERSWAAAVADLWSWKEEIARIVGKTRENLAKAVTVAC